MKIGVVGCGAVGSYYGARLVRAGQQVHFLLRSDYDAVRQNGVVVKSFMGDFTAHPYCAASPSQIGVCDLVIVALKATANEMLPRLIQPMVGPHSAVLTLQNGLGNEECLARIVNPDQILGGLCFVCLNRVQPGVIVHIAHGLIVLGEWGRRPVARTHEIAALFRSAEIPCQVSEDLARAHWEKLVWNIPFNGLGVAGVAGFEVLAAESEPQVIEARGPVLPTDQLLADARWTGLVRELMLEVIRAARAMGFDLPDALADKQIERTRNMGAYKASTLIDYERGQPVELDALFVEPLRQARAAGADVTRLARLCTVLERLRESGSVSTNRKSRPETGRQNS